MNSQETREKGRPYQRGIKPRARRNFSPLTSYLLTLVYIVLAFLTPSCSLFLSRGFPRSLTPPPVLVTSVSGYLSFRLEKDQGFVRGRAFFILIPGRGRIEVIDPVGRQAITAVWNGEEKWLVIPAERAYWEGRGATEELMNTLLGFSLEPVELLGWLIGRSAGLEIFLSEERKISAGKEKGRNEEGLTQERPAQMGESAFFPGWEVEKDGKGRLWRGRKADLTITIEERSQEEVTRSISIMATSVSARVTVLGLEFNRIIPEESFQPEFIVPKGYRPVTREELEALLKRS